MRMPSWPKLNMAMIMAAKARICVQERPEAVPTGELPQNMTLIVDRHLVGKISPGTRVTAIGIYSIYQVHLCYLPLCCSASRPPRGSSKTGQRFCLMYSVMSTHDTTRATCRNKPHCPLCMTDEAVAICALLLGYETHLQGEQSMVG